jgi:hypothetical protein
MLLSDTENDSFPVSRLKVLLFSKKLNLESLWGSQWTTKIREVCHRLLSLSLGKFRPNSGREGPDGCTGTAVIFSLHSATPPATLPPGKKPGTRCTPKRT